MAFTILDPEGIFIGEVTADPASTVNGQFWYNSTLGKYRCKENGTVKDFINVVAGGTVNQGQLWAIQKKFNL